LPKRLLLAVADSAQAAHAADKVFSPAGYSVTQVHDAHALQAALRSKLPDILFIGNPLPGGNPFEIASDLRVKHPTLPIVMLAKKATTADLLRSMQTGLIDYLDFPLHKTAALSAVKRGLEQKKVWEGWLKRETGRITGELHQQLWEMEAILRQVNDGVLVVDKADRVLMMNQALRQTFSLGDADFTGEPVEKAVPNLALLDALKSDDERHEVDQAGRVFHVRVSRIPEIGTVASLHDISYLKEVDRLKGEFVNTVSHDLRSPLTAILGYVELIERAGSVNPQQAQFISRVKSSVYTTTNLIDDLLKLGRVEVGSLDEVTPVNIKLLVVNALPIFQLEVKEKGQTLQMAETPELPPVLGSRTQLNQMVTNLIGNAVKYTPAGGKIRVMLREEQNQIIFHVADNGPGIPLEEQGRIFEKFFRASNAPDGVPGTGLGLAIVKNIVDNHHGRIWVDSKPGKGAVFTVVLPITKDKSL
jgi:signal transduction histidine kinase